MTETMLEKMAAAIWEDFRKPGDPFYPELGPVAEERLSNIARAALQAIREPDDAMLRAGMAGGWCDAEIAQIMHRAMIDAILNGEV